jgi:cell volume regulation protein A
MDSHDLYVVLGVGAGVLLVAVVAVRVSARVGLPSLLLYLGLGMALGDNGAGIRFNDASVAEAVGLGALVLILAEGGLTARWSEIRPAVPAAAALSTAGVGVSIAVTAVATQVTFDTSWRVAFLVGAVLAPTDAAAVFSVLRRLGLPTRLTGLLELESGFNDAPSVLVVVALTSHSDRSLGWLPLDIAAELAIGAAIGLAVAWIAVRTLRVAALPAAGLYPLAVLAFAVGSYAAAGVAHGSGFLAVYLTAVVLGNADLPHRRASRGFAEALAWVAQIGLFVMLGLLVTPSQLGSAVLPALAIGAVLLLVARPVSVVLSTLPFGLGPASMLFASWAGLRGAVPIVLATIPRTTGLPGALSLFNVVFVVVVLFTLVQGPTLPAVARALGLAKRDEPADLAVETAPLEDLRADLLQLQIPPGSRLHGVEIAELRLPTGAEVTLVVRDGSAHVPDAYTRLRSGDSLLIVSTAAVRGAAEQRLRAVSRGGRMAGWLSR